MVQILSLLSAALPFAAAWPAFMELNEKMLSKRTVEPPPRAPLFISGRPNTGSNGPALGFDPKSQLVDVSKGSGHEFVAPGHTDERGQCPGLNAAANHGFLPHNGIPTVAESIPAVVGLGAAYNMAPDLAGFFGVLGVALAGDYLTDTWSIGGSYASTIPGLGKPHGILGTHNRYESDASPTKGDAYLNGGNVGAFDMDSWEHLYSLGMEYTLDLIAAQDDYVTRKSILNNPYYFSGPLSGLVPPAAHNFIINLMSNHSAGVPDGTLTRKVLMSFFAVTGNPGSFVHHEGMERIPDNWYKRPLNTALTIPGVNLDTQVNNLMYPGIVRFGGNVGKVNSFAGVDVTNLTGGLYNSETLFKGNNLDCFMLQAAMAGMTDQLGPVFRTVGAVLAYMNTKLGPTIASFNCSQLADFSGNLFARYPGAKYH